MTIREAIEAGCLYEISNPEHISCGFMTPGAASPAQALATWEHWTAPRYIPAGTVITVKQIVGGSIGCFIVKELDSFIAA